MIDSLKLHQLKSFLAWYSVLFATWISNLYLLFRLRSFPSLIGETLGLVSVSRLSTPRLPVSSRTRPYLESQAVSVSDSSISKYFEQSRLGLVPISGNFVKVSSRSRLGLETKWRRLSVSSRSRSNFDNPKVSVSDSSIFRYFNISRSRSRPQMLVFPVWLLYSNLIVMFQFGCCVFLMSQFGWCVSQCPSYHAPRCNPRGDLPHLTGLLEKAREGALMISRGIHAGKKDRLCKQNYNQLTEWCLKL